ncbi:MAG: phosphopentomutase [Clostridia bacterium]|nr:phosphopentomutase [Clostridia bacterium]
MKRVFLIVLDSVGIGCARDAAAFGDEGAFTLRSVYETGRLQLPNLCRMGLGNIEGLDFLGKTDIPTASVARVREASMGKDTTIGHWEIAGHISKAPLPVFPNGFPKEFLDEFSKRVGRGVLCNKPYSGTKVIADYGEEHLRTGDLIVYTSADSVFQIAAHTDTVPLDELYTVCEIAREMLAGDLGVGRVIARPFAGTSPDFYRTADRRDYSLEPPTKMLPDAVRGAGLTTVSVGKIIDIFAGRGFDRAIRTHSNEEGMKETENIAKESFSGLCFVNLVDFDMLWGHRRDPVKYAEGLSAFDRWVGGFAETLGKDDTLIITADHGCDPAFDKTTDHTREDVPLLIWSKGLAPENFGIRDTFADIGATTAKLLGVSFECDGNAIDVKKI